MSEVHRKRVLDAIGREVGDPEGPRAFFESVRADEPYELGLAVGLDAGGASALVSYNPRTRRGDARERMLAALERVGFDTRATRAAFLLVPNERCSTVLGVEWRPGRAPSATVYLEEVARFHDDAGIEAVQRDLAKITGIAAPPALGRAAYIWAFDLVPGQGRPEALKTYAQVADADAVVDAVRALTGGPVGCEPIWRGGVPRSGFLVQRRYGRGASERLKVYKTYDYLGSEPPTGSDAEVREVLAPFALDERARSLLRAAEGDPTSVGAAFAGGSSRPVAVTGYWRLNGGGR